MNHHELNLILDKLHEAASIIQDIMASNELMSLIQSDNKVTYFLDNTLAAFNEVPSSITDAYARCRVNTPDVSFSAFRQAIKEFVAEGKLQKTTHKRPKYSRKKNLGGHNEEIASQGNDNQPSCPILL